MKRKTFCLRCHQKCRLAMEVVDGKIVSVEDASRRRVPPCIEACPIGTDVPRYVTLISEGSFDEALAVVKENNPLPAISGRICHRPCELDCSRNSLDEPVAIRSLKRAALEYSSKTDLPPQPVPRTHPETVAIVGSGPAGLTAANDLVTAGYGVTIYEAATIAGGVPATTIPEFILPRAVVKADVDSIRALGVTIIVNTVVGRDITLKELRHEHQAVIIATGCPRPLTLKIPGAELGDIYDALSFLATTKNNGGFRITGDVVVIGGGDAAMDAARAALRTGAKNVRLACLESRSEMPARSWEVERAQQEGVLIHSELAPQRFFGNWDKTVAGVEFQRVAYFEKDADGQINWILAEGAESRIKISAHTVIVAIGQSAEKPSLGKNLDLPITSRGTLAVDSISMSYISPDIFACGDVVSGPTTVTESMASGRRAAGSVMSYFSGTTITQKGYIPREPINIERNLTNSIPHTHQPSLEPLEALHSFDEVRQGYSLHQSRDEATRCLDCVTSCPKGLAIPEVMYHPDRLLYPLKRASGRGEGKWTRISWEEALNTIATRIKVIQEKYGPAAVAVSCGSGQKHIGVQALSICKKMWPTPNTHWGRYTCDTPDDMNNSVTFGDLITYEFGPDYEHSRCMVFWGSNPNVATPAQTRDIFRAIRNRAKVMVVDPRPTPMARRADLWLRIRPGTDMALALAMQHVIIQEELYNKDFVEKWCVGFYQLKEHVQEYTPEKVSGITGLTVQDIIKAARMYAKNHPACIYVRLGAGGQQVTSTQTGRSISTLIALCGNVDVPGGNLLYYRTFRDKLFWHVYDMGKGIKGPGAVEEMRFGAKQYPLMHHEAVCDMPGMVRGMENGQVKALWCLADNLVVAEMDSRKIWELMRDKVEFIFVSDFFMTPTAELADIVLPAAFYTEIDTLAGEYMYPSNHVMASAKLVDPGGECKDDREVAIEIAKRLGRDVSPWGTVKEYLNWRLRYLDLTFDDVCNLPDSQITFPREFRRYERSDPPFNTASGKIELYSSVFESISVDPLPVYKEPPQSPQSTPVLYREFPFIYTHHRLWSYMHSEGRQIATQRELIPGACLQINPETAANYGLKEGDQVFLETPQSAGKERISFTICFLSDMHPDVVCGSHAWWFPEKPGPDHGCFESNINTLLNLDPPYDPVVGNVQSRAILCRIYKSEATLKGKGDDHE